MLSVCLSVLAFCSVCLFLSLFLSLSLHLSIYLHIYQSLSLSLSLSLFCLLYLSYASLLYVVYSLCILSPFSVFCLLCVSFPFASLSSLRPQLLSVYSYFSLFPFSGEAFRAVAGAQRVGRRRSNEMLSVSLNYQPRRAEMKQIEEKANRNTARPEETKTNTCVFVINTEICVR